MNKPEITIEEFGAFGPDGLEMKIVKGEDTIAIFRFQDEAEGEIITDMIDALIEAHEIIQILSNGLYGNQITSFAVEQALKKAGVEL